MSEDSGKLIILPPPSKLIMSVKFWILVTFCHRNRQASRLYHTIPRAVRSLLTLNADCGSHRRRQDRIQNSFIRHKCLFTCVYVVKL